MIDNAVIERVLGLRHPEPIACETMGPLSARTPRLLSFLDNQKFLPEAQAHCSLAALFTTPDFAPLFCETGAQPILCDEPRYYFATLYNHLAEIRYKKRPTLIDSSARVHPRAFIADYNVTIGPNVVIESHAAVLPDVEIGSACYIHVGAVLGADGYENKRTSRGVISLFHDGKLILGTGVRIGANASIDKGIYRRDTTIGDNTTVGPLSYVAHAAQIGRNCTLTGTAVVCGSCTIGDHVMIGPNVTISNGIAVGNAARVHLGAVVTKDVADGQSVSGNFAIPHDRFMRWLKRNLDENP